MPNKAAKMRKRKKRLLNITLKSQGRTANQYKKYVEKEKERDHRGLF